MVYFLIQQFFTFILYLEEVLQCQQCGQIWYLNDLITLVRESINQIKNRNNKINRSDVFPNNVTTRSNNQTWFNRSYNPEANNQNISNTPHIQNISSGGAFVDGFYFFINK